MAVFWHRRDLRPSDNVGLAAAASPAVPVFVFDDRVLEQASPNRLAFLLGSLAALREAYRERGGDLHVRQGDPADVLAEVAADHGAEAVHWNIDYSGLARERDDRVAAALDDAGLAVERHEDPLLTRPARSSRTPERPIRCSRRSTRPGRRTTTRSPLTPLRP